jgi:hypothetical protein
VLRRLLLPLLLGLLLAGCSTRPKLMENRAACTLDGTELHVLSKWGPFSIGTRVADADAATVCKKP